ncbi:MAG: alpha/beta fold hydrolase [Thermoguttaceae bacterium]|jgi:pimeloyl-ACP methyl ester carboxylesterase
MRSIRRFAAVCVAAVASLAGSTTRVRAGEPSEPATVPMPTLGGMQFWADQLFFHQWRIQQNVYTGHYRLLDGDDYRHASGTYQQCLAALERIKVRDKLPPMRGKAVVVLHGLGHSRAAMDDLAKYLKEKGGYEVFNVAYPSTRVEIAEHARSLKHILDHLDGIEEINFVAHSMGNIVVRHYLGDPQAGTPTDAAAKRKPDPRLARFVMLGPPNHQAYLAVLAGSNGLFRAVTGEPGQQLGREWDHLEEHLATPQFEFAIIAGGRGKDRGYNPVVPGDNDGVVSVASTRLAGASDFAVLPVMHTFMMNDPKVQEYTLRFLREGCFLSPKQRQPVTK